MLRSPAATPGQALPIAAGTGGLWRGSRPGEQLCGLEAAGAPHSPQRAPLHQPARRYKGSSSRLAAPPQNWLLTVGAVLTLLERDL